MIITKPSMISGKTHSMDLPITQEQLDRFNSGEMVQRVFPNLSPEQREFLLTGITPDEWNNTFPEEDDEDQD